MRWPLIAATIAAAWALARARAATPAEQGDDFEWPEEPDQTATILEQLQTMATPSTYRPSNTDATAARNERAMLDAIAWAEGTARGPQDGYGVLFGWPAAGRTFDASSAADHPRVFFDYTDKAGRQLKTSAAGRYQITATTYRELVRQHPDLAGFTPDKQDRMALVLIDQRGALADVRAGRFADAVAKIRRIWASLPGSGWDQPERPFNQLQAAYLAAGGTLET